MALAVAVRGARARNVVLATAGGSPRLAARPVRAARRRRSRTAGWPGRSSIAALWLALLAYCAVLALARAARHARWRSRAIVAAHVLFLLAPPLLSQDVFSYISYARLDVVHGLDPYTHSPSDVPGDAVYRVRRLEGRDQRLRAAVHGRDASAREARRAGRVLDAEGGRRAREPRRSSRSPGGARGASGATRALPALVVGLNPLVLVHVVGGAHNDALTVLLWMGGVAGAARGAAARRSAGGARRAAVGRGEGLGRGASARSC